MTTHDPRSVAVRTFLQGLGIDLMVALAAVLTTALDGQSWGTVQWSVLGLTLAKTAVQTTVAYVLRRRSEAGQPAPTPAPEPVYTPRHAAPVEPAEPTPMLEDELLDHVHPFTD